MKGDKVLDCLESALEADWEAADDEDLPEELKDATAMMERGRRLLREGLRISISLEGQIPDDSGYRAAARNGRRITEEMLAQMHRDRQEAEREWAGTSGR
ncbi:MAG TPA: hypothetical protein VNX02_11580 [Steroidobacteraceae bacterium]|nr:hypothetical protein [Steroidobacteraceae bacterium]